MASDRHLDRQAELCREVADTVWARVKQGKAADRVLAEWYRRRRYLGSRDRRLLSAIAFSSLRWRGWTTDPAIAYYLDAEQRHEAVDRLLADPGRVEPAGEMAFDEKAEALARWTDRAETPTARDLFPAWLPDDLRLPAFQIRPPTWIRVRHFFRERVDSRIRALEIDPIQHPRLPHALAFRDHARLTKLRQQVMGLVEIQSLVSQAVGHVCAPQPGQKWWDACCGGGGKSLHLNDLMAYKGDILATDTRGEALEQFRRREGHANIAHIVMQRLDSAVENLADQEFDGILLDAPCTGIGTWARSPDARWRLRARHVRSNHDTQLRLLDNVAHSLPPGKTLVYAVCTLTEEETTGTVEAFLAKRPECRLDPFEDPVGGGRTDGTLLLHPDDHHGDGMFIARFTRGG